MPEGDSIVRAARLLDRALADQTLTGCQFRVPGLASVDLSGAVGIGTQTHGKHLFTRFSLDDEVVTVHSHLGMDGQWAQLPLTRPGRVNHEVRVVWETPQHRVLGSLFKTLEILGPRAESDLRERLGPDLLAADFEYQLEIVLDRATKSPVEIAALLLDQTVAAGMGTVLVSETLFLLGINPHTNSNGVDLARVYRKARQILRHSVASGQRVTTGNRRSGQAYWVYGREHRPCRRCGSSVRRDTFSPNKRSIWWCPQCQPPL